MGASVQLNRPRLRIAMVGNTSWNLFNFRLTLMLALKSAGHTVFAVAPRDDYSRRIRAAGIAFEPVNISGGGINPFVEMRSVLGLGEIFRRQRIDCVLSYTPKGNLYSALNCLNMGLPFVPNVSGLGWTYTRRSSLTLVAECLYRITFGHAHRVFFQNRDDMDLFLSGRMVMPDQAEHIPGSGVDLRRFVPAVLPDRALGEPVFLVIARLLKDKGIGEFVEAAQRVRLTFPRAQFRLLGLLSSTNPSAISRQQLDDWVQSGAVSYLGSTDDVRPHLVDADCVVLPSYREGLPRVMLEAAAMGRPVITTDAPGCRDTVLDGRTGYLCRPRDARDLAEKMLRFANLNRHERQSLGTKGRLFVEENFGEDVVLQKYLAVTEAIAMSR